MTGEYRNKDGVLGPEKFENDIQDRSPEELKKSYSEEFEAWKQGLIEKAKAREAETRAVRQP